MKQRYYLMVMAAALMALASVGAYSQTFDLSVRQSIYFTGTGPTFVATDPKALDAAEAAGQYSSPPIHPGITHKYPDILELTTTQAVKCGSDGYCTYNLGVLVWRDAGTGTIDKNDFWTYGQFVSEDGSSSGNTIIFKYDGHKSVESRAFIAPVRLKIGKNKVVFTIDPENKTAETNEANNSVTVYFNVGYAYKVGQESAPTTSQKGGQIPNLEKVPNRELTNSTTTTQKTAPVTNLPLPDLTPYSLEQAKVGVVTVLVRNGCKGKSAATTARLDIYNEATENSGVVKSISANIPALAPGEATTIEFNTGAHGEFDTVIASRLIKVTLDPNNKIKEVSETNNWMTRQGKNVSDIFAPTCTDSFPK